MWLVLALLLRLIWAGTNAADQVLARTHTRHSVLAALIIQYMCTVPCAIIGYAMAGHFSVHPNAALFCLPAVAFAALANLPYLESVRREQAYNVTPYLEFTSIFVIGLAYIFRGETMTPLQLAGAAIVIGSGFLFSWDFMRGRFKLAIFGLLTVSSMLWAGYQFSLSEAGRFADPWEAAACYYVATSVLGFLLFAVCRETRTVIIDTFHATRGQAVKLSLITNALDILALTTFLAALHQAPTIGHVAAVSGLQPIFSFFLAWPLAKVFPQHFSRPAMNRESFYKLALIGLICIGIYFLAAVP